MLELQSTVTLLHESSLRCAVGSFLYSYCSVVGVLWCVGCRRAILCAALGRREVTGTCGIVYTNPVVLYAQLLVLEVSVPREVDGNITIIRGGLV